MEHTLLELPSSFDGNPAIVVFRMFFHPRMETEDKGTRFISHIQLFGSFGISAKEYIPLSVICRNSYRLYHCYDSPPVNRFDFVMNFLCRHR